MSSSSDMQGDSSIDDGSDSRSSANAFAGSPRDTIAAALWIVFAPVSVYAPKASVIFLVLLALAIPDYRAAARSLREMLATGFGAALGVFLIWCIVSSSWSPAPFDALSASMRFAALTLVGLLVFASARATPIGVRSRTAAGMIAMPFLAAFFLCLEFLTDAALGTLLNSSYDVTFTFTGPATATLTIMTLAVLPLIHQRLHATWVGPLLVVFSFLAIFPLPTLTSSVALAVGVAVGALAWAFGIRALHGLVLLTIVGMFAAPWIFTKVVTRATFGERIVEVPTNLQHRLGIWEFAGTRTLERPIFGHGFEASREIDKAERGHIRMVTRDNSWEMERMPLHPHNVALQIWLEMGVVGICLFAGLLITLLRTIQSADLGRGNICAIAAVSTASLTFMFLSFGAWQNWWIATLWFVAVVCTVGIPHSRQSGLARS